ncbi:hypothetical protein KJ836_01335 [Patescibacteria group bacterium]|nr:hypothetical protein [Patescibacteria group bacterium]
MIIQQPCHYPVQLDNPDRKNKQKHFSVSVFVWIPACAGMTVEQILDASADLPE